MERLKIYATRLHFGLFLTVMVNFLLRSVTGYGLNYDLIFGFKIVIYTTGIFLFFVSLKPFKKAAVYYFYYLLTSLSLGLFGLFSNFIFGMMTAILVFPIYPNTTQYKNEKISVRETYQGMLSACCLYELTAPKWLFFEKRIGKVYIQEDISFKNSYLRIEKDSLLIQNDSLVKIEIR
ncbi:hypothetical protein [Flavobacterium sp.]|uniref:hypothetical protein n=1 Tax=Flavobacterium sp. TaxID=239 RepID=UPI0039E67591